MGNARSYSIVRGRRLRIVRLDGCGRPVLGPDSVAITKGFISLAFTANIEEGEPITVTNANGESCINDQPAPKFLNWGVEATLCGVEPYIVNLLTGNPLVYNDAVTPEAVGFGVDDDVNLDDSGFALEVWTGVGGSSCDAPGGGSQFGYTLLPFLQGGTLADFTIENGAANVVITGARTKGGNQWGVGPFDILRDSDGQDSPLLEPLPVRRHLHQQIVDLAPPEPVNGTIALGTPATGATAGTPGSLTPANSYASSLAGLAGVTASPATAWTSGQYIELSDGSRAHWDSSDWVAGPA